MLHRRRFEPEQLGHRQRVERESGDDLGHELGPCATELIERLPGVTDQRRGDARGRGQMDDRQIEPVAIKHLVDDQRLHRRAEVLHHGGTQLAVPHHDLENLPDFVVRAHAGREHRLVRLLGGVPVPELVDGAGVGHDLPPVQRDHPAPRALRAQRPAAVLTPPTVMDGELGMPAWPGDLAGAQEVDQDRAVQAVQGPDLVWPPQRMAAPAASHPVLELAPRRSGETEGHQAGALAAPVEAEHPVPLGSDGGLAASGTRLDVRALRGGRRGPLLLVSELQSHRRGSAWSGAPPSTASSPGGSVYKNSNSSRMCCGTWTGCPASVASRELAGQLEGELPLLLLMRVGPERRVHAVGAHPRGQRDAHRGQRGRDGVLVRLHQARLQRGVADEGLDDRVAAGDPRRQGGRRCATGVAVAQDREPAHDLVARRGEQLDRPGPDLGADHGDRERVDEALLQRVATGPHRAELPKHDRIRDALHQDEALREERSGPRCVHVQPRHPQRALPVRHGDLTHRDRPAPAAGRPSA